MRKVVVVGGGLGGRGGLAGLRAAVVLRAQGFDGALTVLSEENERPYNRPPLSKDVLAGTTTAAGCDLGSAACDAQWLTGTPAVGVDLDHKLVHVRGDALPYDGLIIATGRRARPWPDVSDRPGAHLLRNLADPATLRADVDAGGPVVIIGGGFIGCEVAATLCGIGVADVTIVETAPALLAGLGPIVSARVHDLHVARGVRVLLGVGVAAVHGDPRVEAVELSDGRRLPCATVLVAVGSVPNTEWLSGSGLLLDNGTVGCDAYCRAAQRPDVVAAGDVATWWHVGIGAPLNVEHWTNAAEMGRVAARNLVAVSRDAVPAVHAPVPTLWSDQYDMKIKAAGLPRMADQQVVVHHDDHRLVVDFLRGGGLIGGVAINENRAFIDHRRRMSGTFAPASALAS